MPINAEIKLVPFGQVRLEIGKSIPHVEERQIISVPETVHYHEPQETGSRICEVQYGEKLTNYIVPLSTA